MKVCIAEKPCRIASVLVLTPKRDGFYEGNGYAVTYTFDHLCTLKNLTITNHTGKVGFE
jgi:DNA topoisomerase-3